MISGPAGGFTRKVMKQTDKHLEQVTAKDLMLVMNSESLVWSIKGFIMLRNKPETEASHGCFEPCRSSTGRADTWWGADIDASLAADCQRWMVLCLLVTASVKETSNGESSGFPTQQSVRATFEGKQFSIFPVKRSFGPSGFKCYNRAQKITPASVMRWTISPASG